MQPVQQPQGAAKEYVLKDLPLTETNFIANGKRYFIESGFSIARYAEFQKLQIEAGFGVSFEQMFKNWQLVTDYANKLKFTDIAVLAYNMQNGIQRIQDREPTLLKLCALFINEETEDRKIITPDMISRKIEDWEKEGFNFDGFFTLALNTIRGFIDAWQSLTQTITEAQALKQSKPQDDK